MNNIGLNEGLSPSLPQVCSATKGFKGIGTLSGLGGIASRVLIGLSVLAHCRDVAASSIFQGAALNNSVQPTVAPQSSLSSSLSSSVLQTTNPISVIGVIPGWVLQEGEVSVFPFNPNDIVQADPGGLPLDFRMLGSQGELINWLFLDLDRERIVFNPISGLLGDDGTVEQFNLTLRASDELSHFVEVQTIVDIARVREGCELLPGLVGDTLDPIGGISRYVKCQSAESANNPDHRIEILKLLGRTLGYIATVVAVGSGALTAAAVVRELVKQKNQEAVDTTLTRILHHLLLNELKSSSDEWDTKVLDTFKELHVFPNQRGALRHVSQYRNDVFKILGYALPNLRGTNQQFSAKLLRDFLPIRQKMKYGVIHLQLSSVICRWV